MFFGKVFFLANFLSIDYYNDFVLKEFTKSEIKMYIRNMLPNKSVQSDMPSIQFVKLSAKVIAPYLCKLLSKCVEYGVFPELLKHAEVVPIYKSGKKVILITIDLFLFYLLLQKFLSLYYVRG